MAKKEAKAPADGGWKEEAVADGAQGQWVTPEVGLSVEGKLTRAFFFTTDLGTSAAYEVTGADDVKRLVSEKPFFADSIRRMFLNTEIRLTFGEKLPMNGKDGKPDGREMWKGRLQSRPFRGASPAKRESVMDSLRRSATMAKLNAFARTPEEELLGDAVAPF